MKTKPKKEYIKKYFEIPELTITGYRALTIFDKCVVDGMVKEWKDKKWRKFRVIIPTSFTIKMLADLIVVNYKKVEKLK
jgi:hypothetical protein